MTHGRLFRFLGYSVRALLALTALAAVAVALVWITRSDLIKSLDENLKSRYVSPHQEQLKVGNRELSAGNVERGIEILEALLQRLRQTKKGDRLAGLKTHALNQLAAGYLRLENKRDALRVYDDHIVFDDRDLQAQIGRAALLSRLPDRSKEGRALVEGFYRQVPTAPIVASEFLKLACSRQDLTAAARAAYNVHSTSLMRAALEDWFFFWDTGNKFSAAQRWRGRAELTSGSRVRLKATLRETGKLQKFRVDLPAGIRVSLENIEISFVAGDNRFHITAGDVKFHPRGMERLPGGVLVSRTRAPMMPSYFFFSLPEALPVDGSLEVRFESSIQPMIPPEMRSLLADKALVASAAAELRKVGDTDLLGFFEGITGLFTPL